jgi:hypothetical protein
MHRQNLRILALEPDADCRERLRALLAERIDADVVVVSNPESAAGEIHASRPDLVLISAVLPPRAEDQVIDALKHLDPDGTVPVITVPPMLEPVAEADGRGSMFGLISRRRAPRRPVYDADALVARINEALRQVRQAKEQPRVRPVRSEPSTELMLRADGDMRLVPATSVDAGTHSPLLLERKRADRARRFAADELPSRCTLTTPAGFIVRLLNVSETGVLFESPLKFTPASEIPLSLFGPDSTSILPARIVRSEVANVSGVGVTYQTAAQFNEVVDILKNAARPTETFEVAAPLPEIAPATPSLADLLVRVTTELYQHQRGDAARAAFEEGLRQLVPACEVILCDRLVHRADAGDSIYFAVPGASGVMVQATFEPGHQPTVEEFRLLRAASALASVIVHGETHSLIVRRTA